ncbi:MAG: VOC family protein [Gammaproteobacteria bacterium]|nr:VOC family protein [Gammaproteobacteria bacterium]
MIEISRVSHIGIRVADLARSQEFYRRFGFELVAQGEADYVAILKSSRGIEINLIVNANGDNDGNNILMDISPKYPGYTHVALEISSIDQTVKALEDSGIPISGGPMRLGEGMSLFIRDPDRNVIELRETISS